MSKKIKYGIVGAVLAVVAVGLTLWWILVLQKTVDNAVANVYQNGVLLRSIDLNAVTEPYRFTVLGEHGAYNTVLVEPGYISVESADCPDQICVSQGRISNGVLPIACLPHGLLIQIESADDTLDGVT